MEPTQFLFNSRNIVFNSDYKITSQCIPDKYFDFVISDIPYGLDVTNMAFTKERKNSVLQKNGTRLNPFKNKDKYESLDWDKAVPKQDYFDEMVRISNNQIIFGVEYIDWQGLGPGRIKWNKGVADGMSFKKYEMAYCSSIDYEYDLDLLWNGMRQAKSLSEPMVQQGNKKLNEKRIHPCHKPVLLYDKLLLEFGFKGMKVYDSHVGGGSIRISCDKFGASEFVGNEINKGYFIKQDKRYFNFSKQKNMFYGI